MGLELKKRNKLEQIDEPCTGDDGATSAPPKPSWFKAAQVHWATFYHCLGGVCWYRLCSRLCPIGAQEEAKEKKSR